MVSEAVKLRVTTSPAFALAVLALLEAIVTVVRVGMALSMV